MVPPMINKYYLVDMSPGRSYVEFCVAAGIPGVRGELAQPDGGASGLGSRHVRRRRARSPPGRGRDRRQRQVNTVSLCAGGITTQPSSDTSRRRRNLVNCATFGVTLLDFTVPTMIGLLASPAIIENSVRATKRGGVLPGASAKALFSSCDPTTSSGTTGSATT